MKKVMVKNAVGMELRHDITAMRDGFKGADFLIFTGDKLTKADLIGLGSGVRYQMCLSCHWPNCTFGRY